MRKTKYSCKTNYFVGVIILHEIFYKTCICYVKTVIMIKYAVSLYIYCWVRIRLLIMLKLIC